MASTELLAAEEPEEPIAAAADAVAGGAGKLGAYFASLGLGDFLSSLLSAIIVFLVCFAVIKLLLKITNRILDKGKRVDETAKRFLRTAIRIFLWLLVVVTVAGVLGIPTASLVAVISIAGVALSLSLQSILTNLFSGMTLLFTRPVAVGEYVEIGSNAGIVRSVGLYYTTIVTPNGQIVTIPNGDVAGAAIVNYGREPKRRAQLLYEADYDDPTEDVLAALLAAAAREDRFFSDPAPDAFINSYKDSTIEYGLNIWVDVSDYWDALHSMNALVREEFEKHGVHMSFNHINVHMVN